MKILILSEYFYPFAHGGSEWSTYFLVKGVSDKEIKVIVLTPNYGTKNQELWRGIKIIRMPFVKKIPISKPHSISPIWFTNLVFFLISLFFILRAVLINKIDIIHVQGNYFLPPAVIAGWILRKKVIVTIRDYQILCPYGFCLTQKNDFNSCSLSDYFLEDVPSYIRNYVFKSPINVLLAILASVRARIIKYYLSFFLKRVSKIVCISKKQEQIYNINGFLNTKVIYNPMEFSNNIYKEKRGNIIVYVGRLTPGKGILLLIKSFISLLSQGRKLKLIIIGEGFLRNKIEKMTIKINKHIKFAGQLPYHQTLDIIKKAKVIVVPSLWEEPFGRVALEAISQGTTAVVTNRGGLPEIVEDKITGFIVNPSIRTIEAGILQAIKHNKRLRENIKKLYPKLKNKFYKDVINSYIQIYQTI